MKTYTEHFSLLTRDCDLNASWRPGAVLLAMQEAGGAHSEQLGAGRNALALQNLAWVLTRIELDMDRYPKIGEALSLETFPGPVRRWFFPRYFVIRDAQDREIGRAASLWVLLDLTTRRMAQPAGIAALMPDNRDLPAPLGLPGSVTEVSGVLEETRRFPMYSDLDANRHVNNTRYVDWACDALGVDCMAENELAHLTVNYNMEVKPGQEVRTQLRRLGSDFSYSGFVGDERHFDIGGTLRPRRST